MKTLIGMTALVIVLTFLVVFNIYIAPVGVLLVLVFVGAGLTAYLSENKDNFKMIVVPFFLLSGVINAQKTSVQFGANYHIVVPYDGPARLEVIESVYTIEMKRILYRDEETPSDRVLLDIEVLDHKYYPDYDVDLYRYRGGGKKVDLYINSTTGKLNYMVYRGTYGVYYVVADAKLAEEMFTTIRTRHESIVNAKL